MKKLILIMMIGFAPLFSKGQAYQYIPMDLDTSSFWVHEYDYWDSDIFSQNWRHNHLELTTAIVGDTIVNGETYKKYYTGVTKVYTTELPYVFSGTTGYLKDTTDAQLKLVYGNSANWSSAYIDFDTHVGDTILSYPYDPSFWAGSAIYADSIRIENILGTDRRVTYFNVIPGPPFTTTSPNRMIEGVGMLYDFPFAVDSKGSLGFAPSGLTCLCYSKNDTVRFLNNYSADSCYKKKKVYPYPNALATFKQLSAKTSMQNNQIQFSQVPSLGLSVKLLSINGQELLNAEICTSKTIDVSYIPTGIYILSLQSSKGIENRKILIR